MFKVVRNVKKAKAFTCRWSKILCQCFCLIVILLSACILVEIVPEILVRPSFASVLIPSREKEIMSFDSVKKYGNITKDIFSEERYAALVDALKEKVNPKSIFEIGVHLSLGKWIKENEIPSYIDYVVVDSDDKTITLMSCDAFAAVPYDYDMDVNWNKSFIRKWLNEYFYEKSFSDIEKKLIIPVFDEKEDTYDLVSLPSIDDLDRQHFAEEINSGAKVSKMLSDKYKKETTLYYNPTKFMWFKDRYYITRVTKHSNKCEYLTREIKDVNLSFRPVIKIDKCALLENWENLLVSSYEGPDLSDFDDYMYDNYTKNAEEYYEMTNGLIENKNNSKVVYLTFDDGPSSKTGQVLDILKEENIKASFFMCNYGNANNTYVKRMINEGHTICLHGFSHDYAKIYADEESFYNNINDLKIKLENDFGINAKYFRFPGGSSNTVSRKVSTASNIMTKLVKYMSDRGYRYFDWTHSSGDAAAIPKTKEEIYANVINGMKNGDNIILMHDSNSHQQTVDALDPIIKTLKEMGYTFKAISDETIPCHQMVAN